MSINSSTITIPLSNPLQSLDMRIKFRLHRRSGVEARRIRGDYTFEQLHAVVSQWWDHAHVCWQYADPIDTDDVVTLSSHPEWVECVAIHRDAGKHLITIDVRRANKAERKAAAAAAMVSVSTTAPPENNEDVEEEAEAEAVVENPDQCDDVEVVGTPHLERHGGDGTTTEMADAECNMNEVSDAARDLLVLLFGPDIVRRLWSGDSMCPILSHGLAKIRSRSVGAAWSPDKQVEVELDMDALIRHANTAACAVMDETDYTAALHILVLAASLPATRMDNLNRTHYNTACAYALMGDSFGALRELGVAIGLGYDNVDLMQSDDDLASLRGMDEFQELVAVLKGGKTTAVADVDNDNDAAVVSEEQHQQVVQDEDEWVAVEPAVCNDAEWVRKVAALRVIFTNLDDKDASEALTAANGSLHEAVTMLLQ
eukprot:PhM_4_TR18457/c1_g1_i5/m.17619